MAYNKNTWNNNNLPSISADSLNHMEEGIESAHENIDETIPKVQGTIGEILWTNPDPSEAISTPQNITLSSDDYDILEVFYIQATNGNLCYTSKFLKGYSTRMRIHTADGTNIYRGLTYLNDTSYRIDLPYNDTPIANINSLVIPLYIIGYKTGLFD